MWSHDEMLLTAFGIAISPASILLFLTSTSWILLLVYAKKAAGEFFFIAIHWI
jgi:hypothetical protein